VSFGETLVTVLVNLGVSILGGLIVVVLLEQWLGVSIWLLQLSLKLLPEEERDEHEMEWLGNLSQLEGKPLSAIGHALGLPLSAVSVQLSFWSKKLSGKYSLIEGLLGCAEHQISIFSNSWSMRQHDISKTGRAPRKI
jgi:hypothetical protein